MIRQASVLCGGGGRLGRRRVGFDKVGGGGKRGKVRKVSGYRASLPSGGGPARSQYVSGKVAMLQDHKGGGAVWFDLVHSSGLSDLKGGADLCDSVLGLGVGG